MNLITSYNFDETLANYNLEPKGGGINNNVPLLPKTCNQKIPASTDNHHSHPENHSC